MTDQSEIQKTKKGNGGKEKKEFKRSTFQGAVKELGIFTYRNDRMSAEDFNSAKTSIIDYLNVKNSHAGYALEHNEHFKFEFPPITDAGIRKHVQDQVGKSVANYYINELPEAYGVLIGQCEPSLRAALEELPDFLENIHMQRDLLLLWKAIKEQCLNPIRSNIGNHINVINRYHVATKKFDEFYQYSRESIAEFYRRFDTEVTAAEACGVGFVNETIKSSALKDELEKKKKKALADHVAAAPANAAGTPIANALLDTVALTQAEADMIVAKLKEKALAYEFIKKLNRTVYQDMQVELANRLNDGIDDYPDTVLEARRRAEGRVKSITRNNVPVQNSVAFSATTNSNGKGGNNQKSNHGKPQASTKVKKCYFCQDPGHVQPECPLYKEAQAMLKNKNNTSKVGIQAVTVGKVEEHDDLDAVGFCVLCPTTTEPHQETALVSRPTILDDADILLDNQATVSVFHRRSFLRNLRSAERPITIIGVGGQITATQVGDFGTFGEVYYHPNAVANILCFSDVTQRYNTRYAADKDMFVITNKINGKEIEFRSKNKLYAWNPRHGIEESILVQTVAENMLPFSKREINDAQEAKSAFIKLGRPAMKDFIDMIRNGKLINCPFTVKDIERATTIYGPDLGAIKGRTVRKPPDHVKIEQKDVQGIAEDIVVTGDIFYVFGIPFLLTKSRKMKLLVVQHLEDGKKHDAILKGFKSVMQLYNKYNLKLSHFISDTEAGLQGIEGYLNELGIQYIPASKNQHVGEIERCIRQVKERVRAFVTTLPFLLTRTMLVYVVYFCVRMINSFPHDGNPESPREMLMGKKLDYKNDCKLEFGAYVQVNEDNAITNTMASRTVGAICLGIHGESSSYRFLSLQTWKVITRGSWTVLPLPSEVIDIINKKAIEEDEKGHLKSHPLSKKLPKQRKTTSSSRKQKNKVTLTDGVNGAEAVIELSSDSDADSEYSEYSDDSAAPRFEDYVTSSDDDNTDDDASRRDVTSASSEMINIQAEIADPLRPSTVVESIEDSFKTFGTIFNISMNDTIEGLKSLGSKTYAKFLRRKDEDDDVISNDMKKTVLTQLSVKAGIKQWGAKAIMAAMEELRQLIMKDVFIFVRRDSLTVKQLKSILRTLLFLKEKRDGRLKGRCCVDGRPQAFLEQSEDPFSPTVSTETFFVSAVIDSHEDRDVATADIEGAYLIVDMFEEDVIVDLDPVLSAIVVAMFPHLAQYLDEHGRLTARLGKALYGCIQSARMFYEHLKKNLLAFGFVPNPYEPCIFNKMNENGNQVTVTIYVDDVKVSSKDSKSVDAVLEYLKEVYRTISVKRGKNLEYLGMNLNYEEKGKVTIGMVSMVKEITKEIPDDAYAPSPADVNLFKIRPNDALCNDDDKKALHSLVAKLLYVAKRTRPDILTTVSFLTTRVRDPTDGDVKKLNRLMRYLKCTSDLVLTLECPDITQVTCYADAAHFVHVDGKGHSGIAITLGKGTVYNSSKKQKLVSKSSTEAELIAISDGLSQAIWMRNLLKEQGYNMKPIMLYQDNQSTITLIKKGKSTSERTRHVDLRYFFVADRVKAKEVVVEYMPTKEMIADLHTKPLQGALFKELRTAVMDLPVDASQGCVQKNGVLGPETRFSDSHSEV